MPAVIFQGTKVKTLKSILNIFDNADVITGTADPTSSAQNAPQGSLFVRTGASGGKAYIKQDSGSSTNFLTFGVNPTVDVSVADLTIPSGQTYFHPYLTIDTGDTYTVAGKLVSVGDLVVGGDLVVTGDVYVI